MIAVEVDEGQHKSRDFEDETIRYDDLFMAGHGGKWIYIRFNPDSCDKRKTHQGFLIQKTNAPTK